LENRHMKRFIFFVLLIILLTACGSNSGEKDLQPTGSGTAIDGTGSLEARHDTRIPAQYARKGDPTSTDEASIARGAAIYAANCASCHGESGMGDGPAGAALNPAPAALATSISTVEDDYLFWRISEGSGPFNSAMPAWKSALDEQSRWDLIHFLRSLEQ
jgi:mono/diheme cytochrome c family protein